MHARRTTAALLAVAMAAAACSGGGGDAAPTTAAPAGSIGRCAVPSVSTPDLGDLAGEIPTDDAVEVTELDNGLTVYVRENDSPGQRGALSLVVRAGSVQQTDEQGGGAHFLEHMLFNGTERFPGNELITELERFGSEIGPDLNAYTSYDETVYLLELPSVDRATTELAVDVLAEWSSRATIAQADVEDERGVVLEEWRGTTEGASGRISAASEDFVFAGTPYEGRSPIGEREEIESTDAEDLRAFYEDWYQPSNMAVVAVGDFDAEQVQALIEDRFGDLDDEAVPERADTTMDPWDEPRYRSVVEAEQAVASGSLFYVVPEADLGTGAGLRDGWVQTLAMQMIATRLADAQTRGEVPLTDVGSSSGFPAAGLSGPSIDFQAASPDVRGAIAGVVEAMERACRFGFTDDELDRALAEQRAALDQEHDLLESKQDQAYRADYQESFLRGAAIPDGDTEYELNTALLDSIEVEDVEAWFARLYGTSAPSIFVVGTSEDDVPDEDELAELAAAGADLDLEEVDEVDVGDLELMERPAPAEVVSRERITELGGGDFDGAILTFANGITVVVQRSIIAEGLVGLGAASPGGLSLVADADVAAGELVDDVVTSSGVGDLDEATLRRLLADRSVDLSLWLDTEEERVSGSAATGDVEALLALVHLYLTEPRATDAALTTAVNEQLPVARDLTTVPQAALYQALTDLRFGDEPRYRAVPDPDGLEAVTAADVQRVAAERFGAGGDFVFVLVGDFDVAEVERLAASYLGTLPPAEPETWVDRVQDAPAGVQERTVRAGSGDQGELLVLHDVGAEPSEALRSTATVLDAVTATRLREVIREELAASYAPSTFIDVTDQPEGVVSMLIDVSGDPTRLDELVEVIERELADLAAGGISDDELDRAVETVANDYELWNNDTLIETHLYYATHPDEPLQDFVERSFAVRRVTKAQVVELASRLFDPDRYVRVTLVPAG